MSLKVTLLGTGVGIPQPGRAQSGLVVRAGGPGLVSSKPLLFDCGAGILNRLTEAGIGPLEIDVAFLTHLHLDHCADLLPLAKARWLLGVPEMTLYGPEGTEAWVVAQKDLYPYLDEMDVRVHELKGGEAVSLGEDRMVRTAGTVHSVSSIGYRVEAEGSAFVYPGDTEPCESVAELARGAGLLVHECSFPEPFVVTNHSTPKRLGETIRDVRRIVLTHLYPQARGHEEEMARLVEEGSGAKVELGVDLCTLEV